MGEMTAYTIEELVSQAESGGSTLAEVLTSRLSANDLDMLQRDLSKMIAENYKSIDGFMADVEVPSIAGLSVLSDSDLDEIQHEVLAALSDEALVAQA
ncbi:MAG: hypothetical protein QG582_1103 [Candidatus Thermoplasmatota archaeon]|nr:hypothetical protein [Candidatus Thermoplasmatota archaeon]